MHICIKVFKVAIHTRRLIIVLFVYILLMLLCGSCVCVIAKAETLHTDRKNVVVVALLVIKLFLNRSNENNTIGCALAVSYIELSDRNYGQFNTMYYISIISAVCFASCKCFKMRVLWITGSGCLLSLIFL